MTPTIHDYNLDPYHVLLHWMFERKEVHIKRARGLPKPWTNDPILQSYRFCNVQRVYDKVTQHYNEWIKPVAAKHPRWDLVIFNTAIYRHFNWPDTLNELGLRYNITVPTNDWVTTLSRRRDNGDITYTSAYMIAAELGDHRPKYMHSLEVFTRLSRNVEWLVFNLQKCPTIENATKLMGAQWYYGDFLAYEVATDLTYNILRDAPDIHTWANAGPGALRGLNRLARRPVNWALNQETALHEMRELLSRISPLWPFNPSLVMRDIEHSLCEFDKYCRVLTGEGRPKQLYNGRK